MPLILFYPRGFCHRKAFKKFSPTDANFTLKNLLFPSCFALIHLFQQEPGHGRKAVKKFSPTDVNFTKRTCYILVDFAAGRLLKNSHLHSHTKCCPILVDVTASMFLYTLSKSMATFCLLKLWIKAQGVSKLDQGYLGMSDPLQLTFDQLGIDRTS